MHRPWRGFSGDGVGVGVSGDRDNNPSTWSGGTAYFTYPWWNRLFADENFWQKYIDRYFELRQGPFATANVHAIIDGMIDSPFIRDNVENVATLRERDRILDPDHIAQAYMMLHRQPRSAWTFELDLRPWAENW